MAIETSDRLTPQMIGSLRDDTQAHLDAFVVGLLGTWDPEKGCLLPIVGIGLRKYGTLFKKLCCWEAISGSYEVWAAQCRRHFQWSSSS